jgi:predicted PurR-regulated permease PerM
MVKQFEQLARRRGLLRTAGIERHLWQIPAMCDVLIVLGSVCALWFLYALRDIFLPVFLALILAHVINPFVTLMERRWAWPRPLTISGILTVIAASVLGLFIWLGPVLYEQSTMLVNKFPTYLNTLAATYGVESGDLINRIDESIRKFQIDPQKVLGQLFRTTGHAVGILTFIFTSATYLALSIVLFAIYLFFFSWHFNTGLAKLSAYVPESRKERVFGTIGKMDAAIGDFFRGRLLIFLGILTGFLNIVPYLSLVSWPVAIILKYLDALTTGTAQSAGILAIVVWPTIVYVAVQLLEGWILTPWIQSGQTNLSAATIILVVTIGAVLAGVLGMLLAIPIAACVKIFFEEVVLPPLKRWAAMH